MRRRLSDVLPVRELVYDYVGIERGGIDGENVRKVGVTMHEGLPIDSTSLVAHLASSFSVPEGLVKVAKELDSAESVPASMGSSSISLSS